MPTLYACPLSRLAETVAATGARHVLSLETAVPGPRPPPARPAGVAAGDHAVVRFSDIVAPRAGHVLPGEAHVAAILAFARAWPRERPLVIHCYAGISRSPAAAYVAACALAPGGDEDPLADALRAAAPSATPNPRLVALADRMLGREGRMIAAIGRIGRGAEAYEGTPFALALA